jgi:hypothetical protein
LEVPLLRVVSLADADVCAHKSTARILGAASKKN